ncbi:MAG: murein biosynthesis integral membrane protein MurJ [Magnetococcales bacterium]|nr:murein biosynthesis integral membrane protein MurJ [Magnetococcales bacterium]
MTDPKSAPSSPISAAKGPGRRLLRAVGTISFYTLLSRIMGFARDVVIARGFGAGMGADAFFVALKLPNFLRRLFAEGAFGTAFVPVFSDYLARGDERETRRAAQAVFTLLTLALTVVVMVGQVIMPLLIMISAPGFVDDAEKYQLTIDLTRITFPYIGLISLVALAGGILNSHRRFALPAATPILLNVFLILGALVIAPYFERPAMGLAIGVFLGGVAQLAIQLPALKRLGLPFRFRWEPNHPAIKRILTLMGPSILGVSVAQINLVFDILLASLLPAGSISYLYYADRLVEFPLGLVGIAMATAILPALSARAANQDIPGLKRELDFALRVVVVINIPATVGLIALREPILSLLFERGAFDPETTRLTAQALLAYSVGLIAFSGVKVIAPAFYAMKDTRTPVRIAIICLLSNMVLNVILMFPLQHAGLALASSLASFLNVGLLLKHLRGKLGFTLSRAVIPAFWKTCLASGVMFAFLELARVVYWQGGLTTLEKGLFLMPVILGGMVLFLGVARVLKLKELTDMIAAVRSKKK